MHERRFDCTRILLVNEERFLLQKFLSPRIFDRSSFFSIQRRLPPCVTFFVLSIQMQEVRQFYRFIRSFRIGKRLKAEYAYVCVHKRRFDCTQIPLVDKERFLLQKFLSPRIFDRSSFFSIQRRLPPCVTFFILSMWMQEARGFYRFIHSFRIGKRLKPEYVDMQMCVCVCTRDDLIAYVYCTV